MKNYQILDRKCPLFFGNLRILTKSHRQAVLPNQYLFIIDVNRVFESKRLFLYILDHTLMGFEDIFADPDSRNQNVGDPDSRNQNVADPDSRNQNVGDPDSRNQNIWDLDSRIQNVGDPDSRNQNVGDP